MMLGVYGHGGCNGGQEGFDDGSGHHRIYNRILFKNVKG